MKNRILLSTLSASLLAVGAPVHANLVTNGSFESGARTGNTDTTLAVGDSTTLAGWTVVNDRIDWITGGSQWGLAPSSGNAFLDLTRLEPGPPFGGVSQQIDTSAGQKYVLTFALGSYTARWGGPPVSIIASAGGTSQTFRRRQLHRTRRRVGRVVSVRHPRVRDRPAAIECTGAGDARAARARCIRHGAIASHLIGHARAFAADHQAIASPR